MCADNVFDCLSSRFDGIFGCQGKVHFESPHKFRVQLKFQQSGFRPGEMSKGNTEERLQGGRGVLSSVQVPQQSGHSVRLQANFRKSESLLSGKRLYRCVKRRETLCMHLCGQQKIDGDFGAGHLGNP